MLKNIPNISTFYIDGVIIDRIPQKTNKPDKYIKWAERVVDGKLIVNYFENEMTTSTYRTRGGLGSLKETTTAVIKYYIRMPDGTFYDITKGKDLKKHILPYLAECEKFNSRYDNNFEKEFFKIFRNKDFKKEFNEIVTLYNELCN